jgi:hypothetical protein
VFVTCYVVIFIYDSYYGLVCIMDVNRGIFGTVIWVRVTCTETAFNAAGFMVLIYFCSSTTCEIRCCTNVLFFTVPFRNDVKNYKFSSVSVKCVIQCLLSVSQSNVQTVRNVSSVIS